MHSGRNGESESDDPYPHARSRAIKMESVTNYNTTNNINIECLVKRVKQRVFVSYAFALHRVPFEQSALIIIIGCRRENPNARISDLLQTCSLMHNER